MITETHAAMLFVIGLYLGLAIMTCTWPFIKDAGYKQALADMDAGMHLGRMAQSFDRAIRRGLKL